MKMSLSVLFAALLLVPALHAKAAPLSTAPPPASSAQATSPELSPLAGPLELPRAVTRSGHEFNARCNDADFAEARFPTKLYSTCARLLSTWRWEASNRDNRLPISGDIQRVGAPRFLPPPTPMRAASGLEG